MQLTRKRNEVLGVDDQPTAKRPRKRWKRVVKWTLGTIFVALVVWGFVAYWTTTNDCDRKTTAVPANPMKAVIKCEYGIENLKLRDVEKPTPADDQLLVRVRAISVNPVDGHLTRGMWLARMMGGLRKPKDITVGVDYSGVVEAVGKNVTSFKPGDEVFGGKTGAFAEYIAVKADRGVVLKPANISFEQAGSVGVAGLTALQGLRDKGHVQAGQKVLINGASGGVGTFAVQIAKSLGAEVTGVCSTRNIDLVKSIGADRVIDYTKEDFTKGDQHYDVIFDNVQNHSLSERQHVLVENGICVLAGIGGAGWHPETAGRIAGSFIAPLRSKFSKQKFVFFIAQFNHNDLAYIADLMQSGKVTPVIDRTYKSLIEVPDALQYLEQGHARGKVVISLE
jgi:NADPH:quinone reductase-like Zn-dependent oxidoreductase